MVLWSRPAKQKKQIQIGWTVKAKMKGKGKLGLFRDLCRRTEKHWKQEA